jgi:hypothetical protein
MSEYPVLAAMQTKTTPHLTPAPGKGTTPHPRVQLDDHFVVRRADGFTDDRGSQRATAGYLAR